MSLISFRVENQKSIVLAEATSIPRVMVIAGPNGVGKSTLLYAIKNGSGQITQNTRIFYQGPHRVLRRTNVRRSWLGGASRWLLDLLSGGDVSGYEGLSFQNPARTPDNVDEAGSTIKHTLGKIENRRQSTITALFDSRKSAGTPHLDLGSLPDIYEPVRTLTRHLLPHLAFSRVDFKNEEDIKCLWMRTDKTRAIELDIDDLSSGEKSIIVLFLPLLEDQVRAKLQALTDLAANTPQLAAASEERVMLIDEPEQHLHPDLQAKILSYIRAVSHDSGVQFVLTTHSPSILDQAFDDELYVLSEPSVATENQLRRIAGNAERLEALKELAGSTYFLTTGRAIVCIEGESSQQKDELTDARLLELIYPRSTAVTLVPTRGKGNVINTVERLREHVPEELFRIRVRGLVDADQTNVSVSGVEILPVCMIENFLLDEQIIFEYLTDIGLTTFADAAAVRSELVRVAEGMVGEEIGLRVQRRIGGYTVRIAGATLAEVRAKHDQNLERVRGLVPTDDLALQSIISEAEVEVKNIVASGLVLDKFRGKVIFKTFYQYHLTSHNISYAQACLEIAKRVGKKAVVATRLDPVFDRLIS